MNKFTFRGNKTLKGLLLLQLAAAAPGLATATTLFSDDFKSGYTWSSLLTTLQSTVQSQLGSKWQYIDWASGHGAIDTWPADSNKKAYRIQYVRSDDLDVMAHKFDPSHTNGTSRPKEIYVQWKEYRSSTFDCGPSKDWRITAYRANEYGGASFPFVDLYGGFGNTNPSGVQPCNSVGLNIQGYGASQPGDPNTITMANYTFPLGTVKTVQLHLKMNSPNNADGAAEMWVDGTKIMGRTNVKISPDGWSQVYIDAFQLGMSATNGGQAFQSTSYIWRTDVVIADTFIGGTTTTTPPPTTTSAPAAPSSLNVQPVQ